MKDLVLKFKEIATKRTEIEEMEKYIHTVFADEILKFFTEKGIQFKEVTSGYGEYMRCFTTVKRDSEVFGHKSYQAAPANVTPVLKTFTKCNFPTYYVKQNSLIVYFSWQKVKNLKYTELWWNPEKETLEEFYNRKLKKVLILL
jgi:hypothetical protein